MRHHRIWDPFLRVFHWALVAGFVCTALLTAPEGRLHQDLGYVVAALIALRLAWGVFGPRSAKFSVFVPDFAAVMAHLSDIATRRKRVYLGHSPLGALMILNLLASIALIALSGFLMTTSAYAGAKWVESLHETLVVWATGSIAVHVGAVLWESLRTGVNLSRAMITGVKDIPRDANIVP
ncbi:cytochrome b/b6 domain-containing protein [Puniceibacterium confluentis]|uniref:cytochrome b/b6 domain-containing protein n=1 Tax=Puniceibacterium confluentis TaxID=1958944 RepID=UPI0011B538B5|nr:cytochrome b/b6 domain-containing protein [Puniceibacterium confluentis]